MTDHNIDEYDEKGHTPLMNATLNGDYQEVVRLLDLGADLNKKDRDWNASTAEKYAARKSKSSDAHLEIEKLLIDSNPHSENKDKYKPKEANYEAEPSEYYRRSSFSETLSGWLYTLGFISLLLAPFTGVTIVTAAAFFVIAWIINH
jgi:hypothetical protein